MGSSWSVQDDASSQSGSGDSVSLTSAIQRIPSTDLYNGALLGLAVGDFLGFLVEGQPASGCEAFAAQIAARFCKGTSQRDNEDAIRMASEKAITLGQYSDDTQMSREMLQSFVDKGTFDPEDCANRLKLLAKERRIIGCGLGSAKAFAKLNQGVDWRNSGSPIGSAGNGASVRASVIGLMFWHDLDRLVTVCCDQSIITHKDPRCQAGAITVAATVVYCMSHTNFLASELLDHLDALCRPVASVFADSLVALKEQWLCMPLRAGAAKICEISREFDDGTKDGISGFVTTSVIFALFIFLKFRSSLPDCLKYSIGMGGDTDSTAAMACCFCGAFIGIDALLQQLPDAVKIVNDQGTWNFEQLSKLATSAFEVNQSLQSKK